MSSALLILIATMLVHSTVFGGGPLNPAGTSFVFTQGTTTLGQFALKDFDPSSGQSGTGYWWTWSNECWVKGEACTWSVDGAGNLSVVCAATSTTWSMGKAGAETGTFTDNGSPATAG